MANSNCIRLLPTGVSFLFTILRMQQRSNRISSKILYVRKAWIRDIEVLSRAALVFRYPESLSALEEEQHLV